MTSFTDVQSELAMDGVHRLLRFILSKPKWSFDEAARQLEVSVPQINEALSTLVSMGLVVNGVGADSGPRPRTPDAMMAKLLELEESATRARLAELQESLSTLSVLGSDLVRLQCNTAQKGAQRLSGQAQVRLALDSASGRARQEVLVMYSGPRLTPDQMAHSLRRHKGVLERGVSLRAIYLESMERAAIGQNHLRALEAGGANVRIASVLPMGLMVVDRAVAYASATPGCDESETLEFQDAGVVNLLLQMFEYCWVHGASVSPTETASSAEVLESLDLDPREQSLLRMLAQGMKDDAVARGLGVSPRTLRRLTADVMQKLNAISRFQAGARAVTRGWVEV